MNQKHFLFNVKIPANWQIVTVDDIKSDEKYSCVAGPLVLALALVFLLILERLLLEVVI